MYLNKSSDIFQSEVVLVKLTYLLILRIEIKYVIKKEQESLHTISTYLLRYSKTGSLNPMKEIFAIKICHKYVLQNVKPISIFTCKSRTSTNNISDMKTNKSKIEKSINVIITSTVNKTSRNIIKYYIVKH